MDSFNGYLTSFMGYIDYSACFHSVKAMWIIIGSVIFVGTVVSVIPQIQLIVANRSSFGLNTISICITSIGQFLLVINYICLHSSDFVGIAQIPFSIAVQRLITFFNVFVLWFGYFFVVGANFVFIDFKKRAKRDLESVNADKKMNRIMTILLISIFVLMGIMVPVIGIFYGFFSDLQRSIGESYGTISAILVIAQYLPQMLTTIRLKDNGSLSMVMLMIQAPGGYASSMFMWIGNGDHWTTWLSIFLGAVQQTILLCICLYYKYQKRKLKGFSINSSTPLLVDNINY